MFSVFCLLGLIGVMKENASDFSTITLQVHSCHTLLSMSTWYLAHWPEPTPTPTLALNANPNPCPLEGSTSAGAVARLRHVYRWRFSPKNARPKGQPRPFRFCMPVLRVQIITFVAVCPVQGIAYDYCCRFT